MLAFTLLLVAGLAIVLRTEIVRLLFQYGRFDEAAVAAAAGTLGLFLLGLPAHGMIAVLARAFYADQETRIPVIGALIAVGINIIVSVLTVSTLGIGGLALGIALGAWVEAVFLLLRLSTVLPGLDPAREIRTWLRFAALAAGSAAVGWAVATGFAAWLGDPLVAKPVIIGVGLVAGAASGAAYLAAAVFLGQPEPAMIRRLLLGALRRGRPA